MEITVNNNRVVNKGLVARPAFQALLARISLVLVAGLPMTAANAFIGNAADARIDELHSPKHTQHHEEPDYRSWAIAIDNDYLVPSNRDQDYTYGVSVAVSGAKTKEWLLSLHQPLLWLDHSWSANARSTTVRAHHFEAGVYGFTPEDISVQLPNDDDRPYASLVYISSSVERAGRQPNVSWRSMLTVGMLGLDIVGDLQNEVHSITNSAKARGWEHQISDGGELTVRYSVARQRLLPIGHPRIELKATTQASVGYLTEASWGISLRIGRILSRWQSHVPELTSYREQSLNTQKATAGENYFLAGFALKARAYNVFLQGQFRDTAVSYDHDELNHLLAETWIGYSLALNNGYRMSYVLRGHSSEIRNGQGDRNVIWGGLTLTKQF